MELARHTDPATSHEAGDAARKFAGELQRRVFEHFEMFGETTDKRLNAYFAPEGYAESTVRKRRSELTAMGLIEDTGRRDGRHAIWRLAA